MTILCLLYCCLYFSVTILFTSYNCCFGPVFVTILCYCMCYTLFNVSGMSQPRLSYLIGMYSNFTSLYVFLTLLFYWHWLCFPNIWMGINELLLLFLVPNEYLIELVFEVAIRTDLFRCDLGAIVCVIVAHIQMQIMTHKDLGGCRKLEKHPRSKN